MILYHVCKSSLNSNALMNLKTFSNLYKIFNSISHSRNLSEKNPIILTGQRNNERSLSYLRLIEHALDILDISNWSAKERKSLISRLTSSDSSESFAVLDELLVYLSLIENIGVENVKYQYHTSGKKPDFKIHLNDKQIILELKSLHDRQSIARIKDIFKTLCKFLVSSIEKKNYYIRLDIDTNRLPKEEIQDKGKNVSIIDVERSVKLLKDSLLNLHLEHLIGLNCALYFGKENLKNLSVDDFITFHGEHEHRTRVHNEQYLKWSELVNPHTLASSPFHLIILTDLNGKECVEISSVDFFSQNPVPRIPGAVTSAKAMAAFHEHLRRAIKEKIKSRQREVDNPYIIVIKTRLDLYWHYTYEDDIEDFSTIKKVIKEELRNSTEISGVIIYYSDLHNGKYIENTNANDKVRVQVKELQHANLLKTYPLPLIDEDIEIEEDDDYDTQLRKMVECFKIEEQITDHQDKFKLLNNIEILLRNNSIAEDNLENIEKIVLKYCVNNEDNNGKYEEFINKSENEILFPLTDIKSSAVSCLLLLLNYKHTDYHLKLLTKLANGENPFVQMKVAGNLYLIYEDEADECIRLVDEYLHKNWYTRHCLLPIMDYFRLNCIELPLQKKFISNIFAYYEEDKKHSSTTIVHAIQLVIYNALSYPDFKTLLFSLLKDASEEILLLFARYCDYDDYVKEKKYQGFIIDVNLYIMNSSSTRVKHFASYTFLNNLKKQNISLYPRLRSYLLKVSKISGEVSEPVVSFSIFEYLENFCDNFPIESVKLLENIFRVNNIKDLMFSSHHLFSFMEKLYNCNLPEIYKNKLIKIARTCIINGEPPTRTYANLFMKKFGII